jgi:putative cardiolipin synthase
LLDFRRLNRRMHNKSFIADNKVAIVGGRNIADDYFDANEQKNFRDLDLLAIGPVVQDASRSFDTYWNDEAAYPVTAFKSKRDTHGDLAKLRVDLDAHARAFAQSDFAQAVIEELPDGATADRRGEWFWGVAALVADQPEKIEADNHEAVLRIGPGVQTLIDSAQSELLLMSPYFVPSDRDEKALIALARRGVTTRIVTNSLASTDEPAVHAGYSEHRRPLLAGGVQLYELKPVAGVKQTLTQYGRSSGVSLHAKSFVVDRRYVFVGSMNMDQRSKLLNTEMGFIVDCPALAKAVAEFFNTVALPANAYQLGLQGPDGAAAGSGQLIWRSIEAGKPTTVTHEPGVGPARRVEVMLLKLLPIDGLL